jgi:hypothetical protein
MSAGTDWRQTPFRSSGFQKRGDRQPALTGLGNEPLVFAGCALVVASAMIFGGGTRQGLWSDGIVQLTSLLLFALLAFRGRFSHVPLLPIALAAAFLVVPLLQLIPLPPGVWTLLPGRGQFAETYEQLGLAVPYMPLSLNPQATWLSILAMLPAIAVLLATATLDHRARRTISLIFIGLGVVSVLLGLAQLMEGPQSGLRIYYPRTSTESAVGFFANRNHNGALLYSLVPLVTAWAIGFLFERRQGRLYWLIACLIVYVAMILGFAIAGSRAALFLGVGATIASLLLAAGSGRKVSGRNLAIIAAATVVALVLVVQFAFFNILGRLDDGVLDVRRWQMAETTTTAALAFQPVGSGLGTFVDIYKIFESPQELKLTYVNHAHNDWMELWLEGGIPFMVVAVFFLGWFGVAAFRAWRAPAEEIRTLDRVLAQAGTITMVLLMVHSLADYPLRTTTLMTLFAFCAGLLIAPPGARRVREDDAPVDEAMEEEPRPRQRLRRSDVSTRSRSSRRS